MKKENKNKTAALKKKWKFYKDDLELSVISLPTVIWYILFVYIPMFGIILAFKQYRLVQGKGFFGSLLQSEWVGLKNFEFLFVRGDFLAIIGRTLGYNIIFIVLQMVVPVALAIMMSLLLNKRFSKVCQTAMFFPHFMSWVVASYFVFAFLSSGNGLVTRLLQKLNITYNFYGKEANGFWPYLIVFLNQWKSVGYNMVVYLAAITSLDQTYYEAAMLDGASKWQQIWRVTIPLLKPTIIIMGIMAIGGIIKSDLGLFYQATKNATALYPSTLTLDVYVYNALTQNGNISMSAAASFFQSVIGFIMIMLANGIVRKIEPESAFF